MSGTPLMEFDSHIAGKNAMVRLWPERIEWGKSTWMSTKTKVALGVMTGGASLLATGVRGGEQESQMILIRSITSVTSQKSGLTKTEVNVVTPAGTVGFRCSNSEAARFKELLLKQVANGGVQAVVQPSVVVQAPVAAPVMPQAANPEPEKPAAPSSDDIVAQIAKLGELRDAGILSEDEFQAKKAELLARL